MLGTEEAIFGPFTSVNYLSVDNWNSFDVDNYIFAAGIRFLLVRDENYPFRIVGSEIGYRNISGKHNFYFNVNVDIIILGYITGYSLGAWYDRESSARASKTPGY